MGERLVTDRYQQITLALFNKHLRQSLHTETVIFQLFELAWVDITERAAKDDPLCETIFQLADN